MFSTVITTNSARASGSGAFNVSSTTSMTCLHCYRKSATRASSSRIFLAVRPNGTGISAFKSSATSHKMGAGILMKARVFGSRCGISDSAIGSLSQSPKPFLACRTVVVPGLEIMGACGG